MRRRFLILFSIVAGLYLGLFPPLSTADDWNRATTAVFHGPVQIPGQILAPGAYLFKIADLTGERNVVQIWSADKSVLYATLMGWPEYLRERPSTDLFVFEESNNGTPPALKSWFHEGDASGETFFYDR